MEPLNVEGIKNSFLAKFKGKYPLLMTDASIRVRKYPSPTIALCLTSEPTEDIRRDITTDYEGCNVEIVVANISNAKHQY